MGFLDDIDEKSGTVAAPADEENSLTAPLVNQQSLATGITEAEIRTQNYLKSSVEEKDADIWRPSLEQIEERRRILSRKLERLSFLSPCPVCHGRAFLHIEGGGFVCRACTPGLFGYPVEACGPDLPEPAQDVDLLMAGDQPETSNQPPADTTPTEEQQSYFAAAWPWIKENKTALLAAGWTMAPLVRRSKFRWPVGPWGVAWLPAWIKPEVVVSIGRKGAIVFVFSSGGRTITQTAARL